MNKILKLSKFLASIGLTDESQQVNKIAQALPPGASIDPDPHGSGFMVPTLSESILKKNLDLKKIFKDHYDENFFNSFTYIHYFRGTDGNAEQFVKEYGMGSGGNPMELSVVGAPNISPCSLMNKTESIIGDSRSFAFVLDGTPTSAFYYDATSSYFGQMVSPPWLETLRGVGINPDEYNPKVTALPAGRLNSFFYSQDSYNAVAEESHKSDYHEIFLKNAKVKYVLISKKMDKDTVREFLEEIDPYWLGDNVPKKIDIILCSGDSSEEGVSARSSIMKWLVSFFITDSKNLSKLDYEAFEKAYFDGDKALSHTDAVMKRNEGINILTDALSDDSIDEGSLFSGLAKSLDTSLFGEHSKDYAINNFMNKYMTLSFHDIKDLDRMWGEYFGGANRYGLELGFSMQYKKDDYNIITKITKPVFEKIINDIKVNINSNNNSQKSRGISLFGDLLRFLGDTGQFCYRMNLKRDPRAFEYFLEMLKETNNLIKQISNDENLREKLANDDSVGLILSVNDLQEINMDGAEIAETLVSIFRTSVEHTHEDIEEQLRQSEGIMRRRRESGRNY